MGLFSRKPKVELASFCANLYDQSVFPEEPHLLWSHSLLDKIAEEDPVFRSVTVQALAQELLSLRLEVIGIAWSRHTKDDIALAQSEFTKSYLVRAGRTDLWPRTGAYNKAVAESAVHGADPATRTGRARLTFINQMRADLFDGWTRNGHDPEASARVANRVGAEVPWKDGLTQQFLAHQLMQRLNVEESESVRTYLTAVVEGFYRGTSEALSEVRMSL